MEKPEAPQEKVKRKRIRYKPRFKKASLSRYTHPNYGPH